MIFNGSHACVKFKMSTVFKEQNILCLRNYDLLNLTTNEESMQKGGRFSFKALCGFGSDFCV